MKSPWRHILPHLVLAACFSLLLCPFSYTLEMIESKVDRDGDVLRVEDILEGFGAQPVSLSFSSVSAHMFMGFAVGEVRIYPQGVDTITASVFDTCLDIQSEVFTNNDLGLLNFQLHPDWPEVPYAYILATLENGYDDECTEEGLFCEKYNAFSRVLVVYDSESGEVTCEGQEVLIKDWCTGSNHHGGGGMVFMLNGDMVLTIGDMSKAEQRDVGDDEYNTCFIDRLGLPQGNFRAQRDDFGEGKVFRISAEALVKTSPHPVNPSKAFLDNGVDYIVIGKGFRNPFRAAMSPITGDVVVADVGLDTAESIKVITDQEGGTQNGKVPNYGWPCIEGDSWIPPFTSSWLVEQESSICDATRGTVKGLPEDIDYIALKEQALKGKVDWVPPAFTYNSGPSTAVTAVHFYHGGQLPNRYENRLFAADFVKSCVFYFNGDPTSGEVDFSQAHVLFEGRSVVDFAEDPHTGVLYGVDAKYHILLRIGAEVDPNEVPYEGDDDKDTPTPAPYQDYSTPGPYTTPVGGILSSPPTLKWEVDAVSGISEGLLVFGPIVVNNFWGKTVTRGYNNQIPGPTIHMEACKTYHLRVINDLSYPNPSGRHNSMTRPNTTNLHTHGLHISGEPPSDDVLFTAIEPGEEHTYMYTVPCDHSGGTFWYHPHHHSSTTLQLGGGAMGALVIEDRKEVHRVPQQIFDMPDTVIVIQEMDIDSTKQAKIASGDQLWSTTATTSHYLINGEVRPTLVLEVGKWARWRLAFSGHKHNHALSLVPRTIDCELNVLAMDGVYLEKVPRPVTELFFTPASRVDVAIRCLGRGSKLLAVQSANDPGDFLEVANIEVQSPTSAGEPADPDLEDWVPCRPYYLEDLTGSNISTAAVQSLVVRETIGGKPFTGPDDFLMSIPLGEVQEWNLIGSASHPFHIHINHMQLVDVGGPDLVPGWYRKGDWVDTVSTDLAVVRYNPVRFVGHVVMHCHISEHSDQGVMAVANIFGDSDMSSNDPTALEPGTCGTKSLPGFGYNRDDEVLEPGPSLSPFPPEAPNDTPGPIVPVIDNSNASIESQEYKSSEWFSAAAIGGGAGLLLVGIGGVVYSLRRRRRISAAETTQVNSPISTSDSLKGTEVETNMGIGSSYKLRPMVC